ncbi:NADPH-flavin oxidoreductase [anaerobic digester metagenome]
MMTEWKNALEAPLNHRTIREFKTDEVAAEVFEQLMEVARRTATSTGMQACSIIRVKDPEIRQELANVCRQEYVARAPELLIFIVDQHRNSEILREMGENPAKAGDMDKFFQGFTDACLMAQNVNNAAESLGLGAVYLGSILNHPAKTIEVLGLPKYTFPVVGLGIGYPNQDPQQKPRMGMELRLFEDRYQSFPGEYLSRLNDYDQEMTTYYDLREANRRSDSFTLQVVQKLSGGIPERQAMMNQIVAQGFDLKLKP